ncbi:MAG: outer membrane protein assembly factor BamA [Cytophagales bacterium]|nr:outer membrane protein assembly factor BamA [Cytophagales bacterium]
MYSQLDESFINYSKPKKYKIGGISVSGTEFLDPNAIIAVTGLKQGDEIQVPGDAMTLALKKLWDQGILGDIQVRVSKIVDNEIFFDFYLKERPRLSKFVFFGIKKGEQDDLREKIKLIKGKVLTDVVIKNTQNKVKNFFVEKGFKNTKVIIQQARDSNTTTANTVTLRIIINKGRKIRVDKVEINGNMIYPDKKLRAKLKHTRNYNLGIMHIRRKFNAIKYEEDKKKMIDFYNNNGYRDMQIIKDTTYLKGKKYVDVKIGLSEGRKYYFRNIDWEGNYLYTDQQLSQVLGVKKGDVYNMSQMEKRLNYNPNGADVSSLYLDDGYLFFSVDPVEVSVQGDSIDIEMRMYEGPQATINKVSVAGNTKTNDRVILREIRTMPGRKFSRADLIRSQREIATLGYFDPEQIGITPKPNPEKGTVDIDYTVAEKPSDQIELSGGWGGWTGFIGTLGISFNNFSARNISKFRKWSPLPAGDGQKLSLRVQANGAAYQSYSASFSEPWLGGKRPINLGISLSHSVSRIGLGYWGGLGSTSYYGNNTAGINTAARGSLQVSSISLTLGRRIRWPDDYFTLSHSITYSYYVLDNYSIIPAYATGFSNNFYLSNTLARNSIDSPIFPRKGSSITTTLYTTPPYSLLSENVQRNIDEVKNQQYKLVEYYKVMFDMAWYTNLLGGKEGKGFLNNLVICTRAHFGFIGRYNSDLNYTPFERFVMGGSGLSGFNFVLGSDIIGLRGYANNSIGPYTYSSNSELREFGGGIVYNKLVYEVRYPITTSQMATVFVLGFFEGGNNYYSYSQFSPFNLKRAFGLGARIFMPAFGMIGVDYGWPLDAEIYQQGGNFTFSIGQQIR